MAKRRISDYDETAGQRRAYRDSHDGKQAGDPTRAVQVMLRAVDSEEPPLHLPLGPVAYGIADRKLAAFREDIFTWRQAAIATDFDCYSAGTVLTVSRLFARELKWKLESLV
jgi:hypothetical protein